MSSVTKRDVVSLAEVKQELSAREEFDASFSGSHLVQDRLTGFLGFIPKNCQVYTWQAEDPDTNREAALDRAILRFQEERGDSPFRGFSPDQKLEFLAVLPALWPNYSAVCKRIGISRVTFSNHMAVDERFKAMVDGVTKLKMDELKGTMWEFSKLPKNFMDRMAVGRVFEPETFDPARRLIIEDKRRVSAGEAQTRLDHLKDCIDADVVRAQFNEIPPPGVSNP